jgi:hypothetical protein
MTLPKEKRSSGYGGLEKQKAPNGAGGTCNNTIKVSAVIG